MGEAVNYVGQYAAGGIRLWFVPGAQRERFRAEGGRVRRQATPAETALALAHGAAHRILPLAMLEARGRAQSSSAPVSALEASSTSTLEPGPEDEPKKKRGRK